jgi:hypothetical protein
MIDYPPGEWSVLLVGAQWVSSTSVAVLESAIANRETIRANFSQLHDTLQQAITTTLAGQEGETADAIRDAFQQGADQAAQIAEKNGSYKTALEGALGHVKELRRELTEIAEEGNEAIKKELEKDEDVKVKVANITETIAACQRQANQDAADCAFGIIGNGQKVVDAQGNGQSFFGMAQDAGINANKQPDLQAIEKQVQARLGDTAPPGAPPPSAGTTPEAATPPAPAPPAPAPNPPPASTTSTPQAATPAPTAAPAPNPLPASTTSAPQAATPLPAPTATNAGYSPGGSLPTGGGGAPSMGGALSSAPSGGMPGMGGALSGMQTGGTPGMGALQASPAGMSAPQGLNSGAPMSATPAMGAGAPGGPVQAMASQAPPTAPTFPTAGAGTPVTVGETAAPTQAPTAAVPSSPASAAYTSEPASPMMSAPAPVTAAPAAPSGPLPAYGSDLRPPTVAAPPTPPPIASTPSAPSAPVGASPPPTSAVPGSAPVHPSAGGGPGVGQPAAAMVRQPGGLPTPTPTPAQAPPGVGTEGAIASAGGALAGALSADATSRTRLQRIVAAVANQQPRLNWAVGDRADDTTVLVTDLASGWIPPGIEIPSAVTLLEPARRRGDIEVLLGEVRLAAATQAGHYRPESDTDEPVPTSRRARRAPDVEDLGWELNQATLYRDGLTRLAHTLATAASRGTGVLESEAEELRNQLTELADRVLDSYPDHVDATDLGNWQLLAAIEALVNEDKTAANYHLAWFLTCHTAAAESIVQ